MQLATNTKRFAAIAENNTQANAVIAAITANLCTNDRLANQLIQNISFISFISLKLCSEDAIGNSAKKTLAPPLLVNIVYLFVKKLFTK